MANICTNIFYCKTDNEDNLTIINDFINDAFEWDFCNEDGNSIEGTFGSRWSFPESDFEELVGKLQPDDTLYMRILSHEFGCEYVSFRIYKNNKWNIKL